MRCQEVLARSILTRSSGYLAEVTSHSLNPYQGCSFGRSLCGVACYVQHNGFLTRARSWGSFLEVKLNAAQLYRQSAARERRWARARGEFSVFLSSVTDPFLPQERTYRLTAGLLQAMLESPPDTLVIQTHSAWVVDQLESLRQLAQICRVRVHLSIEGDQERLPGLPPPAFSLEQRLQAAQQCRQEGLWTVATLAPLFPILGPRDFFARLSDCVDAIVLDHFVGGDGSSQGQRTRRTRLPAALEQVLPGSSQPGYRDLVLAQAVRYFDGPIGLGCRGFAGDYQGGR